jgi:DNA-binding CsgD family transcriptional regulator/PAS domain-containing protein
MVNRSFLAFTDSREDYWLQQSIYDRDIFADVVDRAVVRRALVNGQTIPQTLTDLTMLDGTTRRVIVTGQPVIIAGQLCVLLTLTDIGAWQVSERLHDRYRMSVEDAFASSSASMMIVDEANHIVTIPNQSLCSLLGYRSEELAGRSIDDIDIWPSGITSGVLRAKGGKLLECRVSQAHVVVAEQTYSLWTFRDVTSCGVTERNLAAAIEETILESKWLSQSILENLRRRSEPSRRIHGSELNALTAREREVLALICEGLDDKTMARALNVSNNTIRNHVARLYRKIGVNRRVAAAAWGRAHGFDSEPTSRAMLVSGNVSAP